MNVHSSEFSSIQFCNIQHSSKEVIVRIISNCNTFVRLRHPFPTFKYFKCYYYFLDVSDRDRDSSGLSVRCTAWSSPEALSKMEWFYTRSRKKRKRKKDDFWSGYLRRNCQESEEIVNKRKDIKHFTERNDNQVDNGNCVVRARSEDSATERSQYQSTVFNQIFGKKFESRTILSVQGLSSQPETYHFCQK